MLLRDTVTLAEDRSLRSVDVDGHLHIAKNNISKANVCEYMGREIPGYQSLGLDANRVYRMYRDPAELAKAASTFRNKPLLDMHLPVSSKDPQKDYVAGVVNGDVAFDGTYLTAGLTVWVQDSIDRINANVRRELSPGYRYTPDMTPGRSPEGLPYDGVMRNIIGNHVALVREGRTGSDVIVADESPKMRFKNFLTAIASRFAAPPTAIELVALDEALSADLKSEPIVPEPVVIQAYALDSAEVKALVDAARVEGAAAAKAEAEAAAKIVTDAANALAAAKAEVAPVCGDVNCDTADKVFGFALDHLKVDRKDVPPAAYAALFRVAAKTAAAPAPVVTVPVTGFSMDSIFAPRK